LTYAEGEKGKRSKNPDAIDLAMQGWALIYGSFQQPWKEMRKRTNTARALFDQALKIAPNDADALAGSASTYLRDFTFEFSDAQTDYEAKVLGDRPVERWVSIPTIPGRTA
jgi:adenylate cyclase